MHASAFERFEESQTDDLKKVHRMNTSNKHVGQNVSVTSESHELAPMTHLQTRFQYHHW